MRKNNNKNSKKKKPIDATNELNVPQTYRNRLRPRTENQKEYIRTVAENSITFCQGVAGSGKTHIAIGMALEYLLDDKVKKIIITRPVVESGEKIGYLPGTAEEKLHPYLLPLLDEVHHFISSAQYNSLKTNNKIEIVPLGLMRGRNFHNAFIVADECQNASYDQIKMLLTRIGNNSKMVLTGDTSQSDLIRHMQGGFYNMTQALTDVEGIGISKLDFSDIVRHPIIGKIIARLDSYENEIDKR
ncbi:MAG: PhoH family protein [Sphingobacteriia bacterium]|nr:PhoH family protein [Sphingobacteriia bacterium]